MKKPTPVRQRRFAPRPNRLPPAAKPSPHAVLPIDPDRFYRKSEIVQRRFYGYGPTQFEEKVKVGEIDPLISLSDSGRATGQIGRTILEWQARRSAKAAQRQQSAS